MSTPVNRDEILDTMRIANEAMSESIQEFDLESAMVLVDTMRCLMIWMV